MRIHLQAAPDGWLLSDPPGDLEIVGFAATAEVVIAFCRNAADLPPLLPDLTESIYPSGALWIAWPRKAAGHHSDMTENFIREVALPLGVVDVKVAAIDADWSGLKLVWRLENRVRRT